MLLGLSTSLSFGSLQLLGTFIGLLLGLSKLLEVSLSFFSIVIRLDLGSFGGLLSFEISLALCNSFLTLLLLGILLL